MTCQTRTRIALVTIVFSLLLSPILNVASASPGAHGPDGEHLDAKTGSVAGDTRNRMEAYSEMFELVATLYKEELSILIDRYESNEPVLNAMLEVESGNIKVKAKFHPDQGDYAIDDPAFLKLLRTPGEHALVFTLIAGQDSDLLDGKLVTAAVMTNSQGHTQDDHGHILEIAAWTGLATLGLGIGILIWRRRNAGLKLRQGA